MSASEPEVDAVGVNEHPPDHCSGTEAGREATKPQWSEEPRGDESIGAGTDQADPRTDRQEAVGTGEVTLPIVNPSSLVTPRTLSGEVRRRTYMNRRPPNPATTVPEAIPATTSTRASSRNRPGHGPHGSCQNGPASPRLSRIVWFC